jgi:hypothetical protein
VSFAAITLRVASQRMFIVVSVNFFMTQSGNFWIHHRTYCLGPKFEFSVLKIGYSDYLCYFPFFQANSGMAV